MANWWENGTLIEPAPQRQQGGVAVAPPPTRQTQSAQAAQAGNWWENGTLIEPAPQRQQQQPQASPPPPATQQSGISFPYSPTTITPNASRRTDTDVEPAPAQATVSITPEGIQEIINEEAYKRSAPGKFGKRTPKEKEEFAQSVAKRLGGESNPRFVESLGPTLDAFDAIGMEDMSKVPEEIRNDYLAALHYRTKKQDERNKPGWAMRTMGKAVGSIAQVGQSLERLNPFKSQEDWEFEQQALNVVNDPARWTHPDQKFVSRNVQGLLSALPAMGGAALTGGVGGVALMFGLPSAVNVEQAAKARGANAVAAMGAGVVAGGLETLLFSKLPGKIISQFGGKFGVSTTISEAAKRYAQETLKTGGILTASGLKSRLAEEGALLASGKVGDSTGKIFKDTVSEIPDALFQGALMHGIGAVRDMKGAPEAGRAAEAYAQKTQELLDSIPENPSRTEFEKLGGQKGSTAKQRAEVARATKTTLEAAKAAPSPLPVESPGTQPPALIASGKSQGEAPAEIAARGRQETQPPSEATVQTDATGQPTAPIAEAAPGADPYATIKREHGYDVARYDGEESAELADARRVAESFGLKLQPVTEPTGRLHGANIGDTVYVRGDLSGDALWGVVGHEIGHGIKVEELDVFPQEMLNRAAEARKGRASEGYRNRMEADPELTRREGAAEVVGQFMQDAKFRDRLARDNPTLWQRIMDWVHNALSGAKSRTAQKLLAELQARKVRGVKPKPETPVASAEVLPKHVAADSPEILELGSKVKETFRRSGQDEAADAVNGVLPVLAGKGAFEPSKGYSVAQISRAIHNAAITAARKKKSVPIKAAADPAQVAAKEAETPTETDQAVEAALPYLEPAINSLGAKEQEILRSKDGIGRPKKTAKEIAASLGTTENVIAGKVYRARQKLKKIIETQKREGIPPKTETAAVVTGKRDVFYESTGDGALGAQPGATFTLEPTELHPELAGRIYTVGEKRQVSWTDGKDSGTTTLDAIREEIYNEGMQGVEEAERLAAVDKQPVVTFDYSGVERAGPSSPAAPKVTGTRPPSLPKPQPAAPQGPPPLGSRVRGVRGKAETQPEQPAAEAKPSPAAEQAKTEAEAAKPIVKTYGAGLGGGKRKAQRVRSDVVPDVAKAPTPEIEDRLSKAHGVEPQSWVEWGKEIFAAAWHKSTRHLEYLPKNAEYAVAYDFFRRLADVPKVSQDESVRVVAAILDPLGPQQKILFERAMIADNMLNALDSGQPLRFGFENREQVAAYKAQLDAAVEATPEVKNALATRKNVLAELVDELKSENLVGKDISPEHYYHQQVLTYLEAKQRAARGAVPRPVKRSFQKARVEGVEQFGEEFDYNTSYIEAETSWMTDARIELAKAQLLKQLEIEYDAMPMLRATAKTSGTTWQDVLRAHPELAIWQPRPGNLFYQATTIPEKIAEQLQAGIIDSAGLTAEDLRTVLAMGGPQKQWVVRAELAQQLEASTKPVPPGVIGELADEAMASWKVWTLLWLKRALGYNIRNLTGDADPIIAAAPGILAPTYQGKAAVELWNYYHSDTLPMSQDLRASRDNGVIDAGMTATEIPDISDLAVFKRFVMPNRGIAGLPARSVKAYFNTVKKYTQFREAVMRHAAFLYYKDKLTNGTLEHYGTSKKEVIDTLYRKLGVDVAAATLSRDLMGDYGSRTVLGEWLRRRLIPFWAFQEINIQRYPALVREAWRVGNKGAVAKASVLAGKAVTVALMTRIGAMYGLYWLWNNLRYPDEEKELSPYDRSNPHVTLGRNPDGSIVIFRNVGSVGDLLEWFGLNDATALLRQYADGNMSWGGVVKEMLKSPINKLVGGVAPHEKAPVEILTGKSLFPDVFSPRTTERGEIVSGIGGLQDEYRWAKGMIVGKGNRARPFYWQRWLFGVTDPRQNALSEMYDLRERFLAKKGTDMSGSYPLSKFRNARYAAQNEDYDAFIEWQKEYLTSEDNGGEAAKKFFAMLKRMDPIQAGLNRKDEVEFETKFLNDQQRIRLKIARDYSQKLSVTLTQWWIASKGPMPPTKLRKTKPIFTKPRK